MFSLSSKGIMVIAAAVFVGVAVIAALMLAQRGSSVERLSLETVPDEALQGTGIVLFVPGPSDVAVVAPESAVETAKKQAGGGSPGVLETKLARMSQEGRFLEPRLVWAVSLDPATVPVTPPLGLTPSFRPDEQDSPEIKPISQYTGKFVVMFIDAVTGEWLFGYERAGPAE